MELFWTKGYEATSVSDLTEELGVHPGSLYRTFGDKHALFLRAFTRYRNSQARALAPALLAGGPVLPRIRAALVGFIELATLLALAAVRDSGTRGPGLAGQET
jgi:TetR/AcrR family transcriptional repressor of nem operon